MNTQFTERQLTRLTKKDLVMMYLSVQQLPEASAIIYSIAETAKANNLKSYDYFKHLLENIPSHLDDTNLDFLEDLLPWSPKFPESCRKPEQAE